MTASATSGELRALVQRGLAWKFASQVFLQGSRIVVAVVLARLLSPHDYGLATMVLVFSSLVLVFSDVALGAALIQRRRLSEQDRSTVFWASLAVGAGFTLLGVAMSGPIASFYGEPKVRPLFAALSLGFFVNSLATTQEALLVREMRFRSLELRMMIGTAAGAAAGISVATAGYGAWAIIVQQLAIAAVSTALIWIVSPWRPRFVFSLVSLRDLGSFSGNVFGQRLLYYLHRNADNLLIGRFVGAAALGAYGFAYNVMLVPFSRVAGPLQEVLFPTFSRMQDEPERMAGIWIRATRLVATISIPCLLGLTIVAPDFVHVALGGRWHAAGPLIQILAWVGLLQSLQTLNSNILQALDRTATLFRYSLVFFSLHLCAFVIGLHWGVVGIAAAYAVSSTLVEPLYAWITCRALGVSPWVLLRSLAGIAESAVLMAGAVLAVRLALVHASVPALDRLFVTIATGAAVFVPCSLWRAPEVLAELRLLRARRVATAPVLVDGAV
jgi:O-antigen/teichoic acid export membrane protein